VRQYSTLSENRRSKNLVQLNRTLGRHLDAPQKLALLRAYLGRRYTDRQVRRGLITKVLEESHRVNAMKALHRGRSTAVAAELKEAQLAGTIDAHGK
jgi:hypothetical protein